MSAQVYLMYLSLVYGNPSSLKRENTPVLLQLTKRDAIFWLSSPSRQEEKFQIYSKRTYQI